MSSDRRDKRNSDFQFEDPEEPSGYGPLEESRTGTYDRETSDTMAELYSEKEDYRNSVTEDGIFVIAGEGSGEWIRYNEEDVLDVSR